MTVSAALTQTVYSLVGTNAGPFSTVWPYENAADVAVWLGQSGASVLLTLNVDYTLTGLTPLSSGGTVTLSAGIVPAAGWPAGASVALARATPTGQPSAFGETSGISPQAFEAALDHIERQLQDLKSGQLDVLSRPPGQATTFNAAGHPILGVGASTAPDAAVRYDQAQALLVAAGGGAPPVALSVDTIAALRALPAIIFVNLVFVRRYQADQTGGGGWFYLASTPQAENGGTSIIDAQGRNWLRLITGPLRPEWFGAYGDYSAVDTTAVQNTINACSASGGGLVLCTGRYKVGDLTVPGGVSLSGAGGHPLGQRAAGYVDYYAFTSALRQTGGTKISFQNGSGAQGLVFIRDGLPLILTNADATTAKIAALKAAFTGFGLYCTDQEVAFKDLLVLGHALGIFLGATGGQGRCIVENVHGDNIAGLNLQTAFDICRLRDIHWWPYLTNDAVGVAADNNGNWRDGYGFRIANRCDWSIVEGCFAYGYGGDGTYANFMFEGAANIRVTNWGSDGPGGGAARSGVVGVKVIGTSGGLVFDTGIVTAGLGQGFVINISRSGDAAFDTIAIARTQGGGVGAAVHVQVGNLHASDNSWDTCNYGYLIDDAACKAKIDGTDFQNVTNHFSFNPAALASIYINGWTLPFSYTPTVTAPSATGATFGSIVGECRKSTNRRTSIKVQLTVTAQGTGGGGIVVTTPVASETGAPTQYLTGGITGGVALAVGIPGASGSFSVAKYDNSTALTTGAVLNISGDYDTDEGV